MSNRLSHHSLCVCRGWVVFVLIALSSSLGLAQSEITPARKLLGKVADATLKSQQPANGVITDAEMWQSLCQAWRPNITVTPVDFKKQIVLVHTVDGPNNLVTTRLTLTSQGDLRYQAISPSQKPGPGFGYVLLVVPNDRVLSVNGKRVDLPTTRPSSSAARTPLVSGVTIPPAVTPMETPKVQPPTSTPSPTTRVDNPNAQSIKVEINGLIRTGTIGYGGLSTGAMVVANGIVWELDLKNDPELVQAARRLGANVGVIKGTLTKFDSPDRKVRWIVSVDSINNVGSQEAGPLTAAQPGAGQMADNNSSESNQNLTPPSSPRRSLPTPPRPYQPSTQPANDLALQNPMRQNPTQTNPDLPTRAQAGSQNTFRSIEIVARQGLRGAKQLQMIDASGTVKVEVPASNYFDSFNLAPDGLAKLHQYVGQTDWASVPATTRSTADTNRVMNFEIRIETREGTKRIFIDGPSVQSKPVIRDLFLLLRRPKAS